MRKKFFVILFLITTVCLLIFAHIVFKNSDAEFTPQTNLNAPIDIPDNGIITIQEAEAIDKPIVAMFYVDWCTYCRRYMPTFGELAKKYKNEYSFVVINCDYPENMKKIKEFHIMGFPTLFIIDNKIGHKFSLNIAATTNKNIMTEELNNYIKVRKNLFK